MKTSKCFRVQIQGIDDATAKIPQAWADRTGIKYKTLLEDGQTVLIVTTPHDRTSKSHKLMLRNLAQNNQALAQTFGSLTDFELLASEQFRDEAAEVPPTPIHEFNVKDFENFKIVEALPDEYASRDLEKFNR